MDNKKSNKIYQLRYTDPHTQNVLIINVNMKLKPDFELQLLSLRYEFGIENSSGDASLGNKDADCMSYNSYNSVASTDCISYNSYNCGSEFSDSLPIGTVITIPDPSSSNAAPATNPNPAPLPVPNPKPVPPTNSNPAPAPVPVAVPVPIPITVPNVNHVPVTNTNLNSNTIINNTNPSPTPNLPLPPTSMPYGVSPIFPSSTSIGQQTNIASLSPVAGLLGSSVPNYNYPPNHNRNTSPNAVSCVGMNTLSTSGISSIPVPVPIPFTVQLIPRMNRIQPKSPSMQTMPAMLVQTMAVPSMQRQPPSPSMRSNGANIRETIISQIILSQIIIQQ